MSTNKVLARIYGKKRGWCFTPKDFLDLGTPSAIWQNLHRLEQKGTIRKILKGVYDYPEHSFVLDGPASPNHDRIVQAIARSNGWTIVPEGNTAMNLLGLSTQVPAHWSYYTDGPSRDYEWSGGQIKFFQRSIKETAGLSFSSAVLVQGLKALGQEHLDDETISTLRSRLPWEQIQTAVKECKYVTTWVYEIIKRLGSQESNHA